MIADSRADIACLQELDAGRARSGGIHQAETIARELSMQFHFHPAIRAATEQYGDAILTRFPIGLTRAGMLPRPSRLVEPRGALWIEIESEGVRWQVINTHFGLGRDERRSQARAVAEWIDAALLRPPVIFCGDLNSRGASIVHTLLGAGLTNVQRAGGRAQQKTFATRFPWVCLDYIYVSLGVTVQAAEVITTPLARVASDHFPLVAEISISK